MRTPTSTLYFFTDACFAQFTFTQLHYFKSGKMGVGVTPKGGSLMGAEHFVGDSLLRAHAFQVSDFATTVYLACDSQDEQLEWMFRIGTVLRMLQDGSVAGWGAKAKDEVASLVHDAKETLQRSRRESRHSAGDATTSAKSKSRSTRSTSVLAPPLGNTPNGAP